ncbi:hypothetical protein BCR33DRAFT_782189 [Rhizoclosmatium globosum]|uniref:Cytochrome b5 heme-binding domain-containing protein n=1 Tax=Rhizoclosmatium globosum TaxID=329046 RepID=A0A1Y2CN49_9FUNG|nr:hypothetical protein BCR33DRAFT_782189 [Rhizoclosmatium globosum]|eukprot:ORY48460.1 hypothetical protein BCR33DRAFT_782189 [Rhizoclosmatium globosum]
MAEFNGVDESKPVYLAIKGVVYDVSSARKMYSAGSGYRSLPERYCVLLYLSDASRALGMSSLKPDDCVADYSTLNAEQMETLDKWVAFTKRSTITNTNTQTAQMDFQRKLLEELMNPLLGTTKTYKDPQICTHMLACGVCPFDLFTNTKCDIGHCDKKIHDEKLVKLYQESPDRYKLGHEQAFYTLCTRLISDMDRSSVDKRIKSGPDQGDEKEERIAMIEDR